MLLLQRQKPNTPDSGPPPAQGTTRTADDARPTKLSSLLVKVTLRTRVRNGPVAGAFGLIRIR
jgi:hypothetical protein